ERDWNLGTTSILNDEHISSVQSSLIKPSLLNFTYLLKSYNKGSSYKGLMNGASTDFFWKKFIFNGAGSYLTTEGLTTNTKYLRHSANLARPIWKLLLGVKENTENNKFLDRTKDSLLGNSFSFRELQSYINTIDTAKTKASLSYKNRKDFLASLNSLRQVSTANEATLNTEFSKNPNNNLR